MASFKLILSGFLLHCFSQVQAQKHPVFYGGIEMYRHTGFEDNGFIQFSVGSQVYQFKFLAPEIGYVYGGGSLPELNVYGKSVQIDNLIDGLLRQKFSYSVLTLNPKLKFGEEDAYITFSPKYHFGNYSGQAAYYEYSDDNRYISFKEGEKAELDSSFWSFAIGFEGFQISDNYWFAISLEYTLVAANKVWDRMEFSSQKAFVQSALPLL